MKIHHLNCATLCPRLARLTIGRPRVEGGHPMVCHCLLVETDAGLVLVDTGLGTSDLANPASRLGRLFKWLLRPHLAAAETALSQVEALGFSASDVRHIIPTHLDVDHAGGIPDFPNAVVHVYGPELDAASARKARRERSRYQPAHWAHNPAWGRYDEVGEPWFGFEAVRELEALPPELLLVPLVGHTRGHCGVAVDTGDGWLLHCGDAYFHHREVDAGDPGCPPGLRAFQNIVQMGRKARVTNQRRLRELVSDHGSEVTVFSAHDTYEYDCLAHGRAPR